MTPLITLVGHIGVGHTLCMRVCNTTRGARRLTGPMSVGHFGERGDFVGERGSQDLRRSRRTRLESARVVAMR